MAVKLNKISKKPGPFNRKILLYSEAGAGKTTLIASANLVPEFKDVLVIDADGGSSTLVGNEGILATDARSTKDIEAVLWSLIKRDPGFENVKMLVLDGLSEAVKADLAAISAEEVRKGKRENQDEQQLRDFMISRSRILRLVRMARDIPGITVVFTAWAKKRFPKGLKPDDPAARPTQIAPDFTDSMSDTLQGMVDDVMFLHHDKETDRRVLVTANTGPVQAKVRGDAFAKALGTTGKDGKFVATMEDPTFTKIIAAWKTAYNI